MQILCVAVFVLGLTGCALGPGPDDRAGRPPNIVFVMADDMGYGDVAALNPASSIPTFAAS